MQPTLVHQALLASILEATAAKPGNVHPEASFEDLTYEDFVRSAVVAAPAFENAGERGVGATVLDAVQRTREAVGRNTNLGIALVLAPLAAVPAETSLEQGIGQVLANLDVRDAEQVYEAIRLANPGGLGRVDMQDVSELPSVTLLEAMKMAADRDGIAAQYTSDFSTVFEGAKRLARFEPFAERWEEAIVDPEELARGELKEETGLHAERMVRLGMLWIAYGFTRQKQHVFLASGLKQTNTDRDAEEHDLAVRTFAIEDFERMMREGMIADASTVAAWGLYRLRMSGQK